MSVKETLNKKLSRRNFLKWTSALSATAAVYGCGGGDGSGPIDYESALDYQSDLVMDKSLTIVKGGHAYGCGGKCTWNHHVQGYGTKNAKLIKCTTVGDIPREGSLEADEDLEMCQVRGCVRGFSQMKRTYSPEWIKYPLLQTKERGDITGFKRISWDEALNRVADMVKEVYDRYSSGELPYIPILAGLGNPLQQRVNVGVMAEHGVAGGTGSEMVRYLGPTFLGTGAPSIDNVLMGGIGSCGTFGSVGGGNSVMNYLETDFLILWGCDHQAKKTQRTFFITKAKEAGIPIVTIDPMFTETGAIQSSGYSEYGLPGHIRIKPGADSALTAAMCYYIYKNELHDDAFIREEAYGFYPTLNDYTDSDLGLISRADAPAYQAASFHAPVPYVFGRYPGAMMPDGNYHGVRDAFTEGDPMHVPAGESFVEYLDSFGQEKYDAEYGAGSSATAGKDAKIDAVIDWASELTGIDSAMIVKLARAIAETPNVFLENGWNGGQKTGNGMYHFWLIIGLVAMCGHSYKKGGNLGVEATYDITAATFDTALDYFPPLNSPDNKTGGNFTQAPNLTFDIHRFAEVVFTGKEGLRSDEQLYNDFKYVYGIDLLKGAAPTAENLADMKLEIDMVFGGMHIANSINTSPNTNMHIKAFTAKGDDDRYKIKSFVLYEQMMTPTAQYADIILPACTQHAISQFGSIAHTVYGNKLIEPLYDTKPDLEIDIALAKKLNERGIDIFYSKNGKSDEQLLEEAWDAAAWTGEGTKPTFEEVKEKGSLQRRLTPETAVNIAKLMVQTISPTETGKIQFFSNYYNYRDGGAANGLGNYRCFPAARYVEPYQGQDKILRGENVGLKGIAYPLTFTTKRAKNKSHSTFSNVAMLADYFGPSVTMNSVDAARRGIKDGDKVYIFNDIGCMHVKVAVNERMIEGVLDLGHSTWYRAGSETYEAWYDVDMGDAVDSRTITAKIVNEKSEEVTKDVTYYKYIIPVDIGGCENGLVHNMSVSSKDPWIGFIGDNHFNGNWCEVSKTHPDKM